MRLDKNATLTFKTVVREVMSIGRANPSILDVGCGSGQLLECFRDAGYCDLTGVGYDIRLPPGMHAVREIDLSQPGWAGSLGGRQYDFVIATDVIEHQTNAHQFLVELRRAISDDGWLILTFPNVHNLRSVLAYAIAGRFSGFFGANFNDGHPLHDQHIFVPNRHLLSYFLSSTRFRETAVRYINGRGRLGSQTTIVLARPQPAK